MNTERKVWGTIMEALSAEGLDHPRPCPCFLHTPAAHTHIDYHSFLRGGRDTFALRAEELSVIYTP